MTIKVDRFEAKVSNIGYQFKVDGEGIVTIKDHSTDKIIGMINLDQDGNKNLEIAALIIDAIETWVTEHEN